MTDEGISDLVRLGGRAKVAELIASFVDRIVHDAMIGFLFRNVNIEVLKVRETDFAEAHLGGAAYAGRPIRDAHARHRIMGGQFNRRMVLLERTLDEFRVPEDIKRRWLDQNRGLRTQVTKDESDECIG